MKAKKEKKKLRKKKQKKKENRRWKCDRGTQRQTLGDMEVEEAEGDGVATEHEVATRVDALRRHAHLAIHIPRTLQLQPYAIVLLLWCSSIMVMVSLSQK